MGVVTVFTADTCRHCVAAKALLHQHSAPITEINVLMYPSRKRAMTGLTGRSSVPQIFFNETHIGGNSELQALEASGELAKLLRDCLNSPTMALPAALSSPTQTEACESPQTPGLVMADVTIFQSGVDGSGTRRPMGFDDSESTVASSSNSPPLRFGPMTDLLQGKQPPVPPFGPSCRNEAFVGVRLIEWLRNHCGEYLPLPVDPGLCATAMARMGIVHTVRRPGWGSTIISSIFGRGVVYPTETFGVTVFSADGYYKFHQYVVSPNVLNGSCQWLGPPTAASVVAKGIQAKLHHLRSNYMTATEVDYDRMRESDEWRDFVWSTSALQQVQLTDLMIDPSALTTFAINVYNTLVVHTIAERGPPRTALERSRWYSSWCYNIGGFTYTMNDLEHGILRANSKPPGAMRCPFPRSDPRSKWTVPHCDHRIHFALNCGAKSCPPIRVYVPDTLHDDLQVAAECYCESITVEGREVWLSPLLKWYRRDFGRTDEEVLQRVLPYVRGDVRPLLLDAMKANVKIRYAVYDWKTNSAVSRSH